MIIYFPTEDAEELLKLINGFGNKLYSQSNIKNQIIEQMRVYAPKTINIKDVISKMSKDELHKLLK